MTVQSGYIKSLVTPTTKVKATSNPLNVQGSKRKSWGIDLETIWLPFFTASNTNGDTAIPPAALGAPLRLAYDKAGAVRFSQAGRPVVRIVKELGDNIRIAQDNFTTNLLSYAGAVMTDNPDGYKATIASAIKAGEPIRQHDTNQLTIAIARIIAEAETVAEAHQAETENGKVNKGRKVKELVTA